MERKPNPNNNEEGRIESEEYGPLPSLDYQFFEYMQEGVTVYSVVRDESGEIVDLVITYANIAAYRQRKSLKKGLIGKGIIELYGPEALALDLKKANEVVSTGRGTKYETYFAPTDKYFSVTAFSPKEDVYITLTTDITRRKKVEEEMQIERQKLLDIIEFLPDATFVIDENKKVIAWNKALEEMTGTPKEEIIGKGDYAYSIPFYGDRRPIIVDLIFLSEKEIESKYTYVKREDKTLFAEVFVDKLFGGKGAYIFVKASPLYDKNGNLVGSIETVRDISEQKKAEEKLQDTLKHLEIEKKQLSAIIENAPVGIIIAEAPSGKFLLADKQISEIWRYPSTAKADEFKRYKGFHPDGKPYKPVEWPLSRSVRTGEVVEDEEIEILRGDGTRGWLSVSSVPVRDNKGNIILGIVIDLDITERKKAEEKLQDTLKHLEIEKKQLSAIIENAPVGIIIAEAPSGKFLLANKQISEIWHYPSAAKSDEFKKYKGFHPDGRPYKPKEWPLSRSVRTGEVVEDEEIEILRGDGTKGCLSVSSVPVRDNEGNIIMGIVIDLDITEHKKAEEKTRRALEEIVEAYFELDNDWRFVEANEKGAEIIGKKREELIGNVIWDVIPKAKDEMAYKQYHKAKKENIPVHFETKSISTGEWYEIHAYPSEEGLNVYGHDINELKKAICPPENE